MYTKLLYSATAINTALNLPGKQQYTTLVLAIWYNTLEETANVVYCTTSYTQPVLSKGSSYM